MSDYGGGYGGTAKRVAEDEIDRKKNTVMTVYEFEKREKAKARRMAKEIEKKIVDMDSIKITNLTCAGIQLVNVSSPTGGVTVANYVQTYNFMVLNATWQGTAANQRIGNSVSLMSIQVRYSIQSTQAGSATFLVPVNVRVLILYDMCSNGAFPAWNSATGGFLSSDVTDFSSFSLGTGDNLQAVTSMRNNFQLERFVTLYDKNIILNNNAVGPNGFCDNFYAKLRGKNTYWKGNSSSNYIQDIDKGAILIGVITDVPSNATAGVGPTMFISSRVRFNDD